MIDCAHPDDRVEFRRYPRMGGLKGYKRQCLACFACLDKTFVPVSRLPKGLRPSQIRYRIAKKGRGGLGGDGNSKAKAYRDYLNSPAWRAPGRGVRDQALERDDRVCQFCGDDADTGAHINYPADIRDTTVDDVKASCGPCNMDEKNTRYAPWNQGE